MARSPDLLAAARAEALFASSLPAGALPTLDEATAAIQLAVRMHGGTRGCAAEVAYAYGERPESSAPRMRWAREVVDTLYRCPAPRETERACLAAVG